MLSKKQWFGLCLFIGSMVIKYYSKKMIKSDEQ